MPEKIDVLSYKALKRGRIWWTGAVAALVLVVWGPGRAMGQTYTAGPGLGVVIVDDGYDGTLASMGASTITVPSDGTDQVVGVTVRMLPSGESLVLQDRKLSTCVRPLDLFCGRILSKQTQFNTPPTVETIRIPVLSEIPVLGPILFAGSPYLYLALAVMVAFAYMLFRTRWGLRLRASGEKPSAAGTVGIDVLKIRYRAMFIAGLMAGVAGSSLSLASAGSFQMGMSAGKGFIALAAVIFGAWNPIYAFGAAMVFAFADGSQALLSALGVDVPPQLLNSIPYIVTIIVVAGVVGRVRGPAAAGQPYDQG